MGKLSQSFCKIQILAVPHSYRYISTYNLNLPCTLHLYYIAVRHPENPNPVAWNGTVLLCCNDYAYMYLHRSYWYEGNWRCCCGVKKDFIYFVFSTLEFVNVFLKPLMTNIINSLNHTFSSQILVWEQTETVILVQIAGILSLHPNCFSLIWQGSKMSRVDVCHCCNTMSHTSESIY